MGSSQENLAVALIKNIAFYFPRLKELLNWTPIPANQRRKNVEERVERHSEKVLAKNTAESTLDERDEEDYIKYQAMVDGVLCRRKVESREW